MTIIDYYFNQGGMGSFEHTICKAWTLASDANKIKLEKAFPEHFPTAMMYGNPDPGLDFRAYPNRQALEKDLQGRIITLNRWGTEEQAILTTWSEIKQRGFKLSDRMFNTYNGKPVLQFNHGMKIGCNGRDLSFVTYETLEEILKNY